MAVIRDRVRERPPRAKHAHLDDDDKLLVLWGLSRGWAAGKVARTIPCRPGTVKNYKNRIAGEPGLVFQPPVLVQIGVRLQQCQLCGETRPCRVKAMRHVLAHILPYEVARDLPLNVVEKPL